MTIILDANLLLLFVVGSTSRDYIQKHKRLQSYTDDDFILLMKMLSTASSIIVTPNTLTETSNLAGYIDDPARTKIYEVFRALVEAPENQECFQECFIESRVAVARTEFVRLGLTDSVLLHIAAEAGTLLTADVGLYLAALYKGLKAENFNHYRNL